MVTSPALGGSRPVSPWGKVAARTMLVTSAGGTGVGAASGSLVLPVLGTAFGAVYGLGLGAVTGAVTTTIAALVARRRPQPRPAVARLVFLLPTICAAGLVAVAAAALLVAVVDPDPEYELGIALVVDVGVAVPLALVLMAFAAPWCLSPAVPGLRRPHLGRHVSWAATPTAVVLVGAFARYLL